MNDRPNGRREERGAHSRQERMQSRPAERSERSRRNGKHKNGKVLYSELGEMLFTHFGISGPLALTASSYMENPTDYRITVDCKPGLSAEQLDARLLRDFGESPNRDVEKLLCGLVPHSMAPVLSRRLGLPPTLKANSLTREQRRALIRMLKHFEINVTGVRPVAEAIVTAGGVKVSEVKPNTMESKLVEGLYFAGEVLDVDAYTGGFNLQIAWATGHLAGVSAAERE